MYGWINNCLEDMIITKFGLEKWEKIKEAANCFIPTGDFILSVHYDDELTYSLIEAAAKVLDFPSGREVWEIYGRHFIHFLEANHYFGTLRGQGNTLRDWIQNINEPHRLLRARYPKCTLPEFWCENDPSDSSGESVLLHYYSPRKGGLQSIVMGMCKEAAKVYFDKELEMHLVSAEDLLGSCNDLRGNFAHHSVWRMKNVGKEGARAFLSANNSLLPSPRSYSSTNIDKFINTHSRSDFSINSVQDPLEKSSAEIAAMAGCPFHRKSTNMQQNGAPNHHSMEGHGLPPHPPRPPSDSSFDTDLTSTVSYDTDSKKSFARDNVRILSKSSSELLPHLSPITNSGYTMGPRSFKRIFPFHIIINQNMEIVQLGNKLNEFLERSRHPTLLGMQISEVFSLTVANKYPWSWSGLKKLQTSSIITLHSVNPEKLRLNLVGEVTILDDDMKHARKMNRRNKKRSRLGDDYVLSDPEHDDESEGEDDPTVVAALLVNPVVTDLVELMDMGFNNSDLPRHSFQRDLLQMEEHLKTELNNTVRMTELSMRLEAESKKSTDALKTKRIFVRYVSHEIRTPLNVSLLGLKYLEDEVLAVENAHISSKSDAKIRSSVSSSSMVVEDDDLGEEYHDEVVRNLQERSEFARKFSDAHSLTSMSSSVHDTVLSFSDKSQVSHVDLGLIKDVIADVKASCILAVEILNDLLLYEKIDDGIFSLSKSSMSARNFIGEAEKLFKMQAKGSGVRFVITGNIFCPSHSAHGTSSNGYSTVSRSVNANASAFHPHTPPTEHIFPHALNSFPDEIFDDHKYGDLVSVNCDKAKLHQVLRNLFTNAIKFTPQNGVILLTCDMIGHGTPFESCMTFIDHHFAADGDSHCPSMDTPAETRRLIQNIRNIPEENIIFEGSLVYPNGQDSSRSSCQSECDGTNEHSKEYNRPFLRISVTDSGCGISKIDQQHLFHEFIQVKADKLQNGQGSGLGLWIAANIMKMHGGRIGVVSQGEGSGSTFIMDIPCDVLDSKDAKMLFSGSTAIATPGISVLDGSMDISSDSGDAYMNVDKNNPLYRTLSMKLNRINNSIHTPLKTDNTIAFEQLATPSTASLQLKSTTPSSSNVSRRKPDVLLIDTIRNSQRGFLPRYNSVISNSNARLSSRRHSGVSSSDTSFVAEEAELVEAENVQFQPFRPPQSQLSDIVALNSVQNRPASVTSYFGMIPSRIDTSSMPPPLARSSLSSSVTTPASDATWSAPGSSRSVTYTNSMIEASSSYSISNNASHDCQDSSQAKTPVPILLPAIQSLQEARILIVDDAPSNRKMVKRILSSKFHQLDEAENGQQAVDMVLTACRQSKPYHVVMMDFMMPVMNGLEATILIKQESPHPILIVGVTGNGLELDIQAFKEAGADDVLLKPLNLTKFLEILKSYHKLD